MSRIFFIRHGQASFLKKDYDQLSPLGIEQANLLGQFWKNRHIRIDQVISGDLNRQKQTAEHFLRGAEFNIEIQINTGFDEHHGPEIVQPFFPDQFYLDREIPPDQFEKYRRLFYGSYFKLAIPWVKGELDEDKIGHIESWTSFSRRFKEGLDNVFENCPRGSNILIFTSGGPVGAAVGHALDLDSVGTIQMGWQVKNSSFSEFLFGRGRFSMVSFNETPHLRRSKLLTIV